MKTTVDSRKRCLLSTVSAALLLGILVCADCTRSVAPASVADVCQMEDGSFVAVEGFLQLPNFQEPQFNPETEITIYELNLAAQPDGKSPTIKTRISGTRGHKSNRIAELAPEGYTQSDLRIFTATGETVGSNDRVRISGELWKGTASGEGPCIVTTEKIERP